MGLEKKKVLVVGQTPPPFHGQSMMIKRFVDADFQSIKLIHIRLSFSKRIKEVGRPRFYKIIHLIKVLVQTFKVIVKEKPTTLVYYPVSNSLFGIIKDGIYLGLTKWWFKEVVFYFRAAGISDFLSKKNKLFQKLLVKPLLSPDLCILLTDCNPRDDLFLKSKKMTVVNNGMEDEYEKYRNIISGDKSYFTCIYIGSLQESKGVADLIKAANILVKQKGYLNIRFKFIGSFADANFQNKINNLITKFGLSQHIVFKGELLGSKKWKELASSDVLCFPTYYENESFGNVILEAFMFEKPVVGTDWRSLNCIIDHNESGLLVPVKSPEELSKSIEYLMENNSQRIRMGKNARSIFLKKYTLQKHLINLEKALMQI